MNETKLAYKKTNSLGHDYYKLYRQDTGKSLEKGVHVCDFRDIHGVLYKSIKLTVSVKTEEGKVRYLASVHINGCGDQTLLDQNLDKASFLFKRKYSKIRISTKVVGQEGVKALCFRDTQKPLSETIVANPGYMRNLLGDNPDREIPISYKVCLSENKKEWQLFIAERGSLKFAIVPRESFLSREFHLI